MSDIPWGEPPATKVKEPEPPPRDLRNPANLIDRPITSDVLAARAARGRAELNGVGDGRRPPH